VSESRDTSATITAVVTLAVQLVGCIGAVVVIALVMHGDASRRTIAASAAAVATIVVALLGAQGLVPDAQKVRAVAKGQQALTPLAVNSAGGRGIGLNADFVEWAAAQAPTSQRWYLVPPEPTVMQWVSYRMLPRLAVEHPQKGTFLIFYNTTPRKAGYRASQLADLTTFQPHYSVARLVAAGGSK
jgi:hypothetical protein